MELQYLLYSTSYCVQYMCGYTLLYSIKLLEAGVHCTISIADSAYMVLVTHVVQYNTVVIIQQQFSTFQGLCLGTVHTYYQGYYDKLVQLTGINLLFKYCAAFSKALIFVLSWHSIICTVHCSFCVEDCYTTLQSMQSDLTTLYSILPCNYSMLYLL